MLEWIVDKIMAIVTFVPALFVEQNSPNFLLIRTMFGLMLIALIVYLIAMSPLRFPIRRWWAKTSDRFTRQK
jgi:hypothetical protein